MRRLAWWPLLSALFWALFLALIGLFNYRVDPFHLFRHDDLYLRDSNFQRYVNAGILLTDIDFDALVVGSSYIANLNTELIDRLFGVRSRVISLWGASQKEISETLRLAFNRRPNLRAVFLSAPIWGICSEWDHPVWHFPTRLYRGEALGFVPTLFTKDPTLLAVAKFMKTTGLGRGSVEFTDRVTDVPRWDDQGEGLFGSPERLGKELAAAEKEPVVIYSPEEIARGAETVLRCFDRHVMSFVHEHPGTHFYVFNPPTYQWWLWARNRNGVLAIWNRAQEIIAETTAKLPNADYYDFFAAGEIANDCTRYRDSAHFDPRSGDELVAMMKAGRYRRAPQTNQRISQRIVANAEQLAPCPPHGTAQNAF